MNNKKRALSVLGVSAMVFLGATGVSAYNAKFSFDMNTGLFNGKVYTSPAYKYTKDEDPFLRVDFIESSVRTKFGVVNSNGDARSSTLTTRSATSSLLNNLGMAQNHQYRMGIQTDDGSWYNRYNVRGAWNPDSY